MTSPAMRKLLGPRVKKPSRPITWIKVRRGAPYVRFVIRECSICGNTTDNVVMYRCDNGGVRCLKCFNRKEEGSNDG